MPGAAFLLTASAVAASQVACGGSDRAFSLSDASVWPASANGPARLAVVDGAQYMATSAVGHRLERGTMSVSFAGGPLSATGGCNSTTGSYTLRDGRLAFGRFALQTSMACFTPGKPGSTTEDQDDWLDDLLDDATATIRDGGRILVLSRGKVSVTFGRQGPSGGPTPIAGRSWTARGFEGPMRRPTFRIDDGRATIFTGCNRLAGPAQVVGQTIVFGELQETEGSCDPGYVSRVDAQVRRVMRGRVPYAFYRQTLTLAPGRGRSGLEFDLPQPVPSPGAFPDALLP